MPKIVTPLNDKLLKSLKPKEKAYTKSDGKNLRILIKTNGSKLWEFEYISPKLKKRRKTSFGTYPTVSLKNARKKRDEWNEKIIQNIDPIEEKRKELEEKNFRENKKNDTFEKIARAWHENYKDQVSENYHMKLERILEIHVFKSIGHIPISNITRIDIINILKKLKNDDKYETADRIYMILRKIFMYAVTLEKTPHNIVLDVDKKVILGKKKEKHYPTFTKNEDIKALLLSIDNYQGDISTFYALKILPYLFVRSFNIRNWEWKEINFETKEWVIPSNKMKTKKEFILPLPIQAINILKEMKEFSYQSKYVFPSPRENARGLSDNTLISALRRMGYRKEEFVPHSFRSIFSTIAHENIEEHGFNSDIIESLLAHIEQNKVKAAYNRATYSKQKRKLIQWYADWLDNLKNLP